MIVYVLVRRITMVWWRTLRRDVLLLLCLLLLKLHLNVWCRGLGELLVLKSLKAIPSTIHCLWRNVIIHIERLVWRLVLHHSEWVCGRRIDLKLGIISIHHHRIFLHSVHHLCQICCINVVEFLLILLKLLLAVANEVLGYSEVGNLCLSLRIY